MAVPPPEFQQRVVELIATFESTIEISEIAASNARNLRSALLSDLLSGNHEIPASYDELLGAA